MVGAVHAAAGVGVLEPGAADVGVLLEDRMRDARLLQADRRVDPGHAGTDDGHVEGLLALARDVVERRRRVGILAVQRELLLQELDVVAVHRLADDEVDHLLDRLAGRRRRERALAVAPFAERLEGVLADLLLMRLGDAGLRVAEEVRARADLAAEQLQITGEVYQRAHQRRDVRLLERVPERLVVGGERLDGLQLGFGHGHASPLAAASAAARDLQIATLDETAAAVHRG